MDKILAPIKQRIMQFIDFKGIAKGLFFENLDISASNFRSKSLYSEVGGDVIAKILSLFPEINPEWLITGKEPMLRSQATEGNNKLEITPIKQSVLPNIDHQSVPLYEASASASILSVFLDNRRQVPVDHIRIPNMPKCDGAIHITGDSMYPLLKSGDIVLYKEGFDKDYILWGDIYLVYVNNGEGDEVFAIKYLKKSEREGYIKLVSYNEHHAPQEYPIDALKKWALVKASIRINAS